MSFRIFEESPVSGFKKIFRLKYSKIFGFRLTNRELYNNQSVHVSLGLAFNGNFDSRLLSLAFDQLTYTLYSGWNFGYFKDIGAVSNRL